jgi:hypothetical protein
MDVVVRVFPGDVNSGGMWTPGKKPFGMITSCDANALTLAKSGEAKWETLRIQLLLAFWFLLGTFLRCHRDHGNAAAH